MSNYNDKLRFAMTPSGFKAGTLYSQFPNVSASDFDVVRNSIGTRVNKDGLIEVMDANVPRLDYSDGGCPKLLTEASSQNLITYSEDFSQWSKSNSTTQLTPSSISSFGNYTEFESTALGGSLEITPSTSQSGDATFSIYAKKGTAKGIRVSLDAFTDSNCYVNLENGTEISPNSGQSIKIMPFNDFYRIEFTTNIVSLSKIRLYTIGENSTQDVIGNIYIYGGQLEQKSYATSYILTNGATATRSADQVINAGDSSTFNSQSGVLFIDSKGISDVACLSLHDGTDVNRVSILQYVDINRFRILIDNNGVNQIDFSTDDFAGGLDFKIAVSYSTNNTSFFINGLEVATFNYGIMPSQGTFNQISFNLGSAGFFDFYGKTKSVQFYDIGVDIEQLTGYDSYSAMTSQFNFNVL